jgi:predicted RNA binding protein YcfA (HicA-like mRNA interferase family)
MSERLPVVEGGRLVRALERAGFVVIRIRGSAHFMEHPGSGRRTTVHVHRGETIKRGTLAAILDDAGLTADELRSIL